jgi:hypothetical protein
MTLARLAREFFRERGLAGAGKTVICWICVSFYFI